jgi:hypothetical protein
VRVVPRAGEDAERTAAEADHRGRGVHVAVLGEQVGDEHGPRGVNLLGLLAEDVAHDVEVVDVEVAEDAAGVRDVVLVRRRRVVRGDADDVHGAELAGRHHLSRPPVAGVEAALEADLDRHAGLAHLPHDRRRRLEVERDRLLAEGGTASRDTQPDELCMERRRRSDRDRIHSFQQLRRRCGHLRLQLAGDGAGATSIGVGDDHLVHGGMRGEDAGVIRPDAPHADDPDAHPTPPPPR